MNEIFDLKFHLSYVHKEVTTSFFEITPSAKKFVTLSQNPPFYKVNQYVQKYL